MRMVIAEFLNDFEQSLCFDKNYSITKTTKVSNNELNTIFCSEQKDR